LASDTPVAPLADLPDPAPSGLPTPLHVEADLAASANGSDHGPGAPAPIGVDDVQTPPRKRSSANHRVPKELHSGFAQDPKPKVGDEVELKVGGGKYDAGTRGSVVDVFSAGVIVEVTGDNGRSERLDVPFEAIGPTDA
jgi:hypothetical protein